jgi:hypothetical protein
VIGGETVTRRGVATETWAFKRHSVSSVSRRCAHMASEIVCVYEEGCFSCQVGWLLPILNWDI